MSRSASPNRLCVRELQTVFILASLQMLFTSLRDGNRPHRMEGVGHLPNIAETPKHNRDAETPPNTEK